MPDVIIRAENLGKKYQIRHQQAGRYSALRDVLMGLVQKPFRSRRNGSDETPLEDFWALRDVDFTIERGEAVGIIGRNGAGKSTLLKILSRITEPTTGRVRLGGRVASLLEVGTGFHPELTGRENVFLNGAILGMSRGEIRRKFDEIVTFAGIERFLDTPVKRYSSGMYVRLAFAVAAHLEPEILVVDEVLAVGDAEFQRKCLGKMSEAAQGGRTVLFVSHNMAAVSSLTTRAMVLNAGKIVFDGRSDEAVERYIELAASSAAEEAPKGKGLHTIIREVRLLDASGNPTTQHSPGEPLRLEVTFRTDGAAGCSLEAFLLDPNRQRLAISSLHQFNGLTLPTRPGSYRVILELRTPWLASGAYTIDVTTSVVNSNWDHYVEDAARFEVVYSNPGGQSWDFKHSLGFGVFALTTPAPPQFEAL